MKIAIAVLCIAVIFLYLYLSGRSTATLRSAALDALASCPDTWMSMAAVIYAARPMGILNASNAPDALSYLCLSNLVTWHIGTLQYKITPEGLRVAKEQREGMDS